MSRYPYSNKHKVEDCKNIGIFWLKKNGYLSGIRSGNVSWSIGGNKTGSIGIFVSAGCGNEDYIRFNYTITDNSTGNIKDYDYKITLVTTKCHFGNKRYWFQCQLSKNGKYCRKKVGVLYLPPNGKYFGCRHCYNLIYSSQCQPDLYKGFVSIPDVNKAKEQIKRYYYNGKLTRSHKKYIKLNEKSNKSCLKAFARFGGSF
jgi:hypothetical protein